MSPCWRGVKSAFVYSIYNFVELKSAVCYIYIWSTYFFQARENKEELKTKLKELLREKSDVFNSNNHEEDKV